MDSNNNYRKGGTSHRRRKRHYYWGRIIAALAIMLILLGGVVYLLIRLFGNGGDIDSKPSTLKTTSEDERTTEASAEPTTPASALSEQERAVLEKAELMAAMYDYEGAISCIEKEIPQTMNLSEISNFLDSCRAKSMTLVKWADNSQITHIFFHILVEEEAVAFSSQNYKATDYNTVMTTKEEFLKILNIMYDKGYVLVHLSDIAAVEPQADGTEKMVYQPIMLPEGKIPFVLSQDDLCYYEYMIDAGKNVTDGESLTGYATKLVLTEDGTLTNEMEMKDGSKKYGSFDVVTVLNDFVEEHPDFSYHGAKGTIALTGYNGIFGYRTSYVAYGPGDTTYPSAHIYDNPNIEADRAAAKKVADALRADGWKIASHTWGHMRMTNFDASAPAEQFYRDTDWWESEVETLVGETDIIIFAYGADIGSFRGYTAENQMYRYLKSKGFSYFCNVDASVHCWVQLKGNVTSEDGTYSDSGYLRQGRRNLDGQRMLESILYPEKERLSDLFDSKEVFSRLRPLAPAGTESYLGIKLPETYDPNTLFD